MTKEPRIYVFYQDDGPKGISGQCMSVTSPWRKLYIFSTYSKFRVFQECLEIRKGQSGSFEGRRNPKIMQWWYEEEVVVRK